MNSTPAPLPDAATVPPPRPRATLGTWLLRIFLLAFLLAVAAPVALAVAVLHISGDTRALRNAVVDDSSARWKKRVELNVGSLPFMAARLALPFVKGMDPDIRHAATAIRGVEVSVHESVGGTPDRARALTEADAKMSRRGWDRVVCILERDTAVAVYVKADAETADVKISVLVLNENNMVAVTGRGNLQPVMEIALKKANEEIERHNPEHWLATVLPRH